MRVFKQSEKELESQILNILKLNGYFFFKVNSTGVFDPKIKKFRSNKNPHVIKGVCDILGCVEGKLVAIEVKSKTGRLTTDQIDFQSRVNKEGGLAFTTNDLDDCFDFLNKMLDLGITV